MAPPGSPARSRRRLPELLDRRTAGECRPREHAPVRRRRAAAGRIRRRARCRGSATAQRGGPARARSGSTRSSLRAAEFVRSLSPERSTLLRVAILLGSGFVVGDVIGELVRARAVRPQHEIERIGVRRLQRRLRVDARPGFAIGPGGSPRGGRCCTGPRCPGRSGGSRR